METDYDSSTHMTRGSCMECRRLKTKCSRTIPCQQCIKRQCQNICPDGLRTRGFRNPTVEVDALNRNIEGMTARIRALETALQKAQEGHVTASSSSASASPPPISVTSDFATIIQQKNSSDHLGNDIKRIRVLELLPDEALAWKLVEQFYMSYGWLMQPVSKSHVIDVYLKRSYSNPCVASSSELSALFAIFAMAVVGEGTQPPRTRQSASFFYEASKAALRLQDVLAEGDIGTVEAMTYQGYYLYLVSDEYDLQKAWIYLGITIRLAYSIQLHIDPEGRGYSEAECLRRRRLFQELVTFDIWMSMVMERPPAFHDSVVSTRAPVETIDTVGSNATFLQWRYKLCRDAVAPLVQVVLCGTSPKNYSQVIQIENIVMDYVVPPEYEALDPQTADLVPLLQAQQMRLYREIVLVKLHRAYFILAIEEMPDRPFEHYAARSVTVVLDCIGSLIRRMSRLSVECPRLLLQLNYPWHVALVSMSYLVRILQQVTDTTLLQNVRSEFEMGYKLLQTGASINSRLARYFPYLEQLRQTAAGELSTTLVTPGMSSLARNLSLDLSIHPTAPPLPGYDDAAVQLYPLPTASVPSHHSVPNALESHFLDFAPKEATPDEWHNLFPHGTDDQFEHHQLPHNYIVPSQWDMLR